MRHPKTSIATSAVITAALAAVTALFLTFNTIGGYFGAALFLMFTLLSAHRLYSKLWLYNWGRPLSEARKLKREQMRRQVRGYKRYNLYHVWYRFADATEDEYRAERAKEALKKTKR